MYEGTQCLRLLEWQMIFVASANNITLQGFLSILVVSAEIKSEPEMKWKPPNFPAGNCSFFKIRVG